MMVGYIPHPPDKDFIRIMNSLKASGPRAIELRIPHFRTKQQSENSKLQFSNTICANKAFNAFRNLSIGLATLIQATALAHAVSAIRCKAALLCYTYSSNLQWGRTATKLDLDVQINADTVHCRRQYGEFHHRYPSS